MKLQLPYPMVVSLFHSLQKYGFLSQIFIEFEFQQQFWTLLFKRILKHPLHTWLRLLFKFEYLNQLFCQAFGPGLSPISNLKLKKDQSWRYDINAPTHQPPTHPITFQNSNSPISNSKRTKADAIISVHPPTTHQ